MKYIEVSRNDIGGTYTAPLKQIDVLADFDDIEFMNVGTAITYTIVEMSEEEFENLPEFQGY
jgi:hypothetical protein